MSTWGFKLYLKEHCYLPLFILTHFHLQWYPHRHISLPQSARSIASTPTCTRNPSTPTLWLNSRPSHHHMRPALQQPLLWPSSFQSCSPEFPFPNRRQNNSYIINQTMSLPHQITPIPAPCHCESNGTSSVVRKSSTLSKPGLRTVPSPSTAPTPSVLLPLKHDKHEFSLGLLALVLHHLRECHSGLCSEPCPSHPTSLFFPHQLPLPDILFVYSLSLYLNCKLTEGRDFRYSFL